MLSGHKQRKKKNREKVVRKKLLAKRAAALRVEREDKIRIQAERRVYAAMHRKPVLKKPSESEEIAKEIIKNDVMRKLEHNVEILKAMQEEHDREEAARNERNELLESQGSINLVDKMAALNALPKENQK